MLCLLCLHHGCRRCLRRICRQRLALQRGHGAGYATAGACVQSLKLLGDLLMERNNVRIMVQYVGEVKNLMLVMNLLKDPSRTIEFEAFHVFKVFVANPRKPGRIKEILITNKEKLLRYLSTFLAEKGARQFAAFDLPRAAHCCVMSGLLRFAHRALSDTPPLRSLEQVGLQTRTVHFVVCTQRRCAARGDFILVYVHCSG